MSLTTRLWVFTVWLLLVVQSTNSQNCLPHPEKCIKMNDCCSRNCYGGDQERNITGECQPGTDCTDGGGMCTVRADCCSYNCYDLVCQIAGGDRCTGDTGKCTDSTQCCSLYCDDVGLCSLATVSVVPSVILISVALTMTSVLRN